MHQCTSSPFILIKCSTSILSTPRPIQEDANCNELQQLQKIKRRCQHHPQQAVSSSSSPLRLDQTLHLTSQQPHMSQPRSPSRLKTPTDDAFENVRKSHVYYCNFQPRNEASLSRQSSLASPFWCHHSGDPVSQKSTQRSTFNDGHMTSYVQSM